MKRRANYLLFIDESGKSNLFDADGHFLLSAIIIDKDLHIALSHYMISLKDKSGISPDENIHAFDLFESERLKVRDRHGRVVKDKNGSLKHRHIPFGRVDTFFKRLSSLIEGADIMCLILRMDKGSFKKSLDETLQAKGGDSTKLARYLKRRNLSDFLYESLTRKMILEFGRFLEEVDAAGEVVAESRREEDETVLRAFISATNESTFKNESRCSIWARNSLRRIHSLTFQTKKGLSFGLEIADLFGWVHLNRQYGIKFPIKSQAQNRRVAARLEKVDEMMKNLYKKKPEDITRSKLNTVARDRVSAFTEALKEYKVSSVSAGTPPGNPGGP